MGVGFHLTGSIMSNYRQEVTLQAMLHSPQRSSDSGLEADAKEWSRRMEDEMDESHELSHIAGT